jgi:hypothetical protein
VAEELVQLNPDIIVAPATLQAVAVKKAWSVEESEAALS